MKGIITKYKCCGADGGTEHLICPAPLQKEIDRLNERVKELEGAIKRTRGGE